MATLMTMLEIASKLAADVDRLSFGPPVTHVYNPLRYAWNAHRQYLEKWGQTKHRIMLVGMNPGPWGMAQTGVPFGEISLVRDWIGIREGVKKPDVEHPRRPIDGFACRRREVSGARLWGWARDRFGSPEDFFRRFFVYNYCPLSFLEKTGRNRTPDKLRALERRQLFAVCDRALEETVKALQPEGVLGIGVFAESRIQAVVGDSVLLVGRLLHPSPANPKANRGWADTVEEELRGLGIKLP